MAQNAEQEDPVVMILREKIRKALENLPNITPGGNSIDPLVFAKKLLAEINSAIIPSANLNAQVPTVQTQQSTSTSSTSTSTTPPPQPQTAQATLTTSNNSKKDLEEQFKKLAAEVREQKDITLKTQDNLATAQQEIADLKRDVQGLKRELETYKSQPENAPEKRQKTLSTATFFPPAPITSPSSTVSVPTNKRSADKNAVQPEVEVVSSGQVATSPLNNLALAAVKQEEQNALHSVEANRKRHKI